VISSRTPSLIDKLAGAVVHQPERAIPAPAGAREDAKLEMARKTLVQLGSAPAATPATPRRPA
jgi:hypothetical protein